MNDEDAAFAEKMRSIAVRFADRVPGTQAQIVKLMADIGQFNNAGACPDQLEELVRTVHTMTGTGRQFGFNELADIADEAEKQAYLLSNCQNQDWQDHLSATKQALEPLLAYDAHAELN